MTELKTLKDLKRWNGGLRFRNKDFIETSKLKEEAVKWVKEDIEDVCCLDFGDVKPATAKEIIEKWMKRLNITEADLE